MQGESKRRVGHPSPAMVIAVIALIAALCGTAIGARQHKRGLGKNSVGTRQLKGKAVTTGKLRNNAVNGRKVANKSLTGDDINLGALGTVPSADTAANAGNADTVGGHSASCPGGTTLLRGYCFDSSPNGVLPTLQDAVDACADKGGWLPSVMQLYSVRKFINLGTGVGSEHQYTDNYAADKNGDAYTSVVINGKGEMIPKSPRTSPPATSACIRWFANKGKRENDALKPSQQEGGGYPRSSRSLMTLGATSFASAELGKSGNILIAFNGNISPKKLPRSGTAPVNVIMGAKIKTTDRTDPPKLTKIVLDINRQGVIQTKGLGKCSLGKLKNISASAAKRSCADALIGHGNVTSRVSLPGQGAFASNGPLLAFNGRYKGKQAIFAQVETKEPLPLTYVIVFEVKKTKGTFGTRLIGTLPAIASSYGYISAFDMALKRTYRFHGKKLSYASAGCAAPKGLSLASFPVRPLELPIRRRSQGHRDS